MRSLKQHKNWYGLVLTIDRCTFSIPEHKNWLFHTSSVHSALHHNCTWCVIMWLTAGSVLLNKCGDSLCYLIFTDNWDNSSRRIVCLLCRNLPTCIFLLWVCRTSLPLVRIISGNGWSVNNSRSWLEAPHFTLDPKGLSVLLMSHMAEFYLFHRAATVFSYLNCSILLDHPTKMGCFLSFTSFEPSVMISFSVVLENIQ